MHKKHLPLRAKLHHKPQYQDNDFRRDKRRAGLILLGAMGGTVQHT
jgi:hypothetical protein